MTRREVVFREAQGQDALAFLRFMSQIETESDFLVMEKGGLAISEVEMAAILDASFEAVDQFCFLGLLDDEIIGAVTIRTASQEKINHIGDVFLAVRQPYWGNGIGHILLEEGIDWAHQEGVLARLELTVQVRNQAAVHLYQTAGFEIEGIKKRGAKSKEGDWVDLYYMGRLMETV